MAFGRDYSVGVNLIGRDISASKALNNLGIKAKSTGDVLEKMSKKATWVLAGLGAAAVKFGQAAAEDQISSAKLANTLKTVAGAGQSQIASVEKFITKSSIWAAVTDDQIRPAFDRLVRSTRNVGEAQKLTNLALEIAKQKGKTVEEVANALAKAHDGNVKALTRLGITVKTGAKSQDVYATKLKVVKGQLVQVTEKIQSGSKSVVKFSDVVKQLGKDFNGSIAAQSDTAAYKFERFKVVLGETQETLGYMLLPYLEDLADWLVKIAPWVEKHKEAIKNWALAIGGLAVAIKIANAAYKTFLAIQGLTQLAKIAAGWLGIGAAAKTAAAQTTAAAAEMNVASAAAGRAAMGGKFGIWGAIAAMIGIPLAINAGKTLKNDVLPGIWKGIQNWGIAAAGGIPRHAKGGIVTRPHVGMVGEAGPEAIIPLSKFGTLGGITVINQIQGSVIAEKELALKVRNDIAQLLRRKGMNPAILGV